MGGREVKQCCFEKRMMEAETVRSEEYLYLIYGWSSGRNTVVR
jgi:hypothetical protein